MNVDNVVVDSGLVLLQNFEKSSHIFTGGKELQVRLRGLPQHIQCKHTHHINVHAGLSRQFGVETFW